MRLCPGLGRGFVVLLTNHRQISLTKQRKKKSLHFSTRLSRDTNVQHDRTKRSFNLQVLAEERPGPTRAFNQIGATAQCRFRLILMEIKQLVFSWVTR